MRTLARVACALERYRLAYGDYPGTLDALAPQFIAQVPPDLINGRPLHYRHTDGGRFLLYSVGWDGKDDGGQIGNYREDYFLAQSGDWVWQYPAKN